MSPQAIVAEDAHQSTAAVGKNEADCVAAADAPVEKIPKSIQSLDIARKDIRTTSYFAVAGCVSNALSSFSSSSCTTADVRFFRLPQIFQMATNNKLLRTLTSFSPIYMAQHTALLRRRESRTRLLSDRFLESCYWVLSPMGFLERLAWFSLQR